jgi:hypothetical protein
MNMANEFKPTVGKQISKSDAIKWIEKYDKERKKDTKSVFFGRDAILAALSQEGSAGISFFFARKYDDGQKKDIDDLVMVATKEDGTLLWTDNAPTTTMDSTGSNTYDNAVACPPYCPK